MACLVEPPGPGYPSLLEPFLLPWKLPSPLPRRHGQWGAQGGSMDVAGDTLLACHIKEIWCCISFFHRETGRKPCWCGGRSLAAFTKLVICFISLPVLFLRPYFFPFLGTLSCSSLWKQPDMIFPILCTCYVFLSS